MADNQITIRSDRDTEYTFQYKGEDVTLKAGGILSIADGLEHVVLPTVAMKVINNLIIIKNDVKQFVTKTARNKRTEVFSPFLM